MPTTINEINCYENFKLQVHVLAKYVERLEGIEYLKSCNLIENVFKPYINKSKELQSKLNGIKVTDDDVKDLTLSGRDLHFTHPKFDSEHSLTEKFLSSVTDESLYLNDNLLINNNLLEAIKSPTPNKDNFAAKDSTPFTHSLLDEPIKGSCYYELSMKDPPSHTYLDLSHKSNSIISNLQDPNSASEMRVDRHTDIILNLCSKGKVENSKEDQNLSNESNITEELSDLSYQISTSHLFLEGKFSGKNEVNSSEFNVSNSKDDFSKLLDTNSSENISVIHSTNSCKEDKRSLVTDSEYHSSLSEVDDSVSSETPKVYLKTSREDDDFVKSVQFENHEGKVMEAHEKINTGTETALNLVNKKPQIVSENSIANCSESSSECNPLKATNLLTPHESQTVPEVIHKEDKVSEPNSWIVQENTNNINLFCTHCDIHFKSKVIYNKHVASHKRNTCTQCPSTFSRHQFLRAHMKSEHGIDLVTKTYPCQYCTRVFMKRSSLLYHFQLHALPDQKVCSKCGKFIDGEEAFKEHMGEHIKNASLQCHICDAIFQRYQQYNDHMEGHKKHKCAYCEADISFSSKKSLFKHYKTEHPSLPQKVVLNKKYSCDLCPRVFTRPSLLKDHKLTHTDLKHLECRFCHVKYLQRSSLKKHVKEVHSPAAVAQNKLKAVHSCPQCGYSCSSLLLLNKHSINTHNTTIIHTCSYCDYNTKYRHLLKRHIDTHLEIKKYLCDICGSLFHSSSTLKHHAIFIHSNERRFKCKECNKSFKNNSCLSRHLRIHSNERPYKCECGSGYKQLAHLSRHLSTAHDKKLRTRKIRKINLDPDEAKAQDSATEEREPPTKPESRLEAEAEKSPDEILLNSGSTVFVAAEGGVTPDPAPLFTVLDSQLIHLIPSSTVQLHQEGLHAVSLMNGELHAFSIAPPAPFHLSQGQSLPTSAPSDVITLHPSEGALELETSLARPKREKCVRAHLAIGVETDPEHDDSSQLDLQESHTLHFASTSIQELHYRNSEEESETIPALSSSPFLPHEGTSLSHDISNNNISIF